MKKGPLDKDRRERVAGRDADDRDEPRQGAPFGEHPGEAVADQEPPDVEAGRPQLVDSHEQGRRGTQIAAVRTLRRRFEQIQNLPHRKPVPGDPEEKRDDAGQKDGPFLRRRPHRPSTFQRE